MNKVLAILSLVLIWSPAHALDFDPFKGPKPIVVLIQTNPWLSVIGSDIPIVAVYEDGQIIYQKRERNKRPVLYHKQLNPDEV